MSTTVESSRGAVATIPPAVPASLLASPIWSCPTADCDATLPSVGFLAEHLEDRHGWTAHEVASWWTGWLADRWEGGR